MIRLLRVIASLSFASLFFVSCGYAPVRTNGSDFSCVIHNSDGINGRFLPDMQRAFLENGVQIGNGSYTLHVEFTRDDISQIGYRYDVDPSTQAPTNRLVANEESRTLGARIWVEKGGEILFGPREITGYAQYDFVDPDVVNDVSFVDSSGVRVTSLQYSLGQLDAMEGARRVSEGVASKSLAANIAAAVSMAFP